MSSSREESPDWLRSFQAPAASLVSLSSPDDSPLRESETSSPPLEKDISHAMLPDESASTPPKINSEIKSVKKQMKIEHAFSRRKKADKPGNQNGNKADSEETCKNHTEETQGLDHSVLVLSSDSEPSSDSMTRPPLNKATEKAEDDAMVAEVQEISVKKGPKEKSPGKDLKSNQTPKKENSAKEVAKHEDKECDAETDVEAASNKNIKPCVSTSRLPLVLSEKVNRNKALVECEGDSIDLSGDMGAVGRIVVSDTNQEVFLDLKGTIYKTSIVPSRTFCVVSVGQSEAKIEAIMNDFIQLKPQSNVYEAETMVEGTLEGFSFDSEDEGEKKPKNGSIPMDKSETNEGQAKGKAQKASASGKKRGRPAKEKKAQPAKKARRQSTAPKKAKAKK
ncbi:PREDICTED: DNA-binding protein BIN4 isoform X2 [Tarenaya hassleriana]|uniref:DNA-binding protein BIN4 isoform X2 n=1 Tax=Tarenaya hassleriana TaxID=28532 RepID=UPI00053C81B5|nr:PREDICTED: DNA-binding protein BIN4 isoform X2 [Tarenaya hassleriana]